MIGTPVLTLRWMPSKLSPSLIHKFSLSHWKRWLWITQLLCQSNLLRNYLSIKHHFYWPVVVALLIEPSLLTPAICSSNPVISKILFIYSLSTVLKRRKKKKRPGMAHFQKNTIITVISRPWSSCCKLKANVCRWWPQHRTANANRYWGVPYEIFYLKGILFMQLFIKCNLKIVVIKWIMPQKSLIVIASNLPLIDTIT